MRGGGKGVRESASRDWERTNKRARSFGCEVLLLPGGQNGREGVETGIWNPYVGVQVPVFSAIVCKGGQPADCRTSVTEKGEKDDVKNKGTS